MPRIHIIISTILQLLKHFNYYIFDIFVDIRQLLDTTTSSACTRNHGNTLQHIYIYYEYIIKNVIYICRKK